MTKKTVTTLGIGLGIFLVLILIMVSAYELTYRNRIYPGVKISGSNLGGLEEKQIAEWLSQKISNLGDLELRWGVNEWEISMSELGINYDPIETARQTLEIGRTGDRMVRLKTKLSTLFRGHEIKPVVEYNLPKMEEAIASVSSQINIPAREPEIIKSATSPELVVAKGDNGQEVNVILLKNRIIRSLYDFGPREIDIPVTEIRPQLSEEQAEKARETAEIIIGKTLTVSFEEDKQTWELEDEILLTWIDLRTGGWNEAKIRTWAEDLAKNVDRIPQDASFQWVGENKVEAFKPAKDGVRLVINKTVTDITESLDRMMKTEQDQKIELNVEHVPPEITNEDVNNLGIAELIGKGESWFTGSITNRIYNLKKSADVINGRLVAPGETFSFNEAVGEISADTGYKQAYIIKEGKTILGDGGGVCQVSTVLFRAVLDAGLPITARTPHAYRVSYYEVNYQPGFDATVFQPAPDFKFVNDTEAYILIQAVYDEAKKYLGFEIYGTNDGRVAEVSKARIWEVVSPPPDLYIDDPNLPVGKIVQTEHAARGAKVAFDWKVTREGEILQERTFFSNYRPWQAVYLRGTKTN